MWTSTRGGWGPCPAGELGRLTDRLARRWRRRVALVVAAGVLGTALTASAAWAVASGLLSEPTPSGHSPGCGSLSPSGGCAAPAPVPGPGPCAPAIAD